LQGGGKHRLGLAGLLLILWLGAACGRSDSFHRTEVTTPATEQRLPFHPGNDQASASDGAAPALDPDRPVGSVPFHGPHSRVLPAGTLLTVQLEDTLSSAKVRAGDVFAAIAAPLTLGGDTLIAGGTVVTGHIESARAQTEIPGLSSGSGYFRLSLSAITLGGRRVALETSSLYAPGILLHSNTIRVPKGRHLTFRLTAPVTIEDPKAVASR
jgi:hypothetical protein